MKTCPSTLGRAGLRQNNSVRIPPPYHWHCHSMPINPAPTSRLRNGACREQLVLTYNKYEEGLFGRGYNASWCWLLHLHLCPLAVTMFCSLQNNCLSFTTCFFVKSEHVLQEVWPVNTKVIQMLVRPSHFFLLSHFCSRCLGHGKPPEKFPQLY